MREHILTTIHVTREELDLDTRTSRLACGVWPACASKLRTRLVGGRDFGALPNLIYVVSRRCSLASFSAHISAHETNSTRTAHRETTPSAQSAAARARTTDWSARCGCVHGGEPVWGLAYCLYPCLASAGVRKVCWLALEAVRARRAARASRCSARASRRWSRVCGT